MFKIGQQVILGASRGVVEDVGTVWENGFPVHVVNVRLDSGLVHVRESLVPLDSGL